VNEQTCFSNYSKSLAASHIQLATFSILWHSKTT